MARVMADQDISGPTPPRWAGDYFNREHLLPGGAILDAEAFTEGARVPAGTVVGRKLTESTFGPAADTDEVVYIVAFDVDNVSNKADVELYRHGGIVKTNFLPGYDELSATVQGILADKYELTTGV